MPVRRCLILFCAFLCLLTAACGPSDDYVFPLPPEEAVLPEESTGTEKPISDSDGTSRTIAETEDTASLIPSRVSAETAETTVPAIVGTPAETEKPIAAETSVIAPETDLPDDRPETAAPEAEPPQNAVLSLLSVTDPVAPGGKARLTISGQPGVTYTIAVFYPSGVSSAKGLESKQAGADGTVTWEWRVGSRTKAGKHRIEITGGGESLTLDFTTT